MKKLFLLAAAVLLLFCTTAFADPAEVTTAEDFLAAMADEAVEAVTITGDMTITACNVTMNKDVTILADVTFQPERDPNFFVCSWEIPEGRTLTIGEGGSFTTVHTFTAEYIVIAQIYVHGGSLDVSAGQVSNDCNICFNAGSITPPAGGFDEGVSIARYIYEGYTDEELTAQLAAAFREPLLREVNLQIHTVLCESQTIPAGMRLNITGCWLTIGDGIRLQGSVTADEDDSGVILERGGTLNDRTLTDAGKVLLIWNDAEQRFVEQKIIPAALTETIQWHLLPTGKLMLTGTGAVPDFTDASPAPWQEEAQRITEMELSEGITGIGAGLLRGTACTSLRVGSTITAIAEDAFADADDDFAVQFPKTEGDFVKNWLHSHRITFGEGDDTKYHFRTYHDNGYREIWIEDGVVVGTADFDEENGVLVREFHYNVSGERTYMAFYTDGETEPSFWVRYTAYRYGENDRMEVDYEAMIGGEHRIGTDYMQGRDEQMIQLAAQYTLDDGTQVRCDYAEDGSYTEQIRNAQGELTAYGCYDPNWQPLRTWVISAGNTLVLPAETQTISQDAFQGVKASVVRLGSSVTTIEDGAFPESMLVLVPEGSPIIPRLQELQLTFVII